MSSAERTHLRLSRNRARGWRRRRAGGSAGAAGSDLCARYREEDTEV